jgi:hypothetical protein
MFCFSSSGSVVAMPVMFVEVGAFSMVLPISAGCSACWNVGPGSRGELLPIDTDVSCRRGGRFF